jgi:Fic family protein
MYKPIYQITNSILKNIGTIEACREVIDHAPLLPYYEKKFQQDALNRTVHHGTHIEGNELNISQAERVMLGQQIVARQRDVQEVINYRNVMEYISEFQISPPAGGQMSNEIINKLHKLTVEKIVPGELCGEFRKTQVVIKNNQSGEVSFRPPPAISVPYQIKDLIDYINQASAGNVHPVLQSGIFHYEFVRIHPFIEGNGRVARAIATLILFSEGYDIRKFFSLEEYFDQDAGSYYQALQSVIKNDGDQSDWLSYFTEGLAIELSKIKEKVEKISIDNKLRSKLGGKPLLLSERQLKIIEYIQETGYLQNNAFSQLFPFVSEDTVLNELKALIASGIVKKHGTTKAAKYIMN